MRSWRRPPVIPIVFGTTPSLTGLEAAGVLSSWFGVLGDYRAMRFPVSVGTLPTGNVVLIAEGPNAMPPGLNLPGVQSPTVAVRTNPVDPYGKVLIVTGADADQTLAAAQALATGWPGLQGATSTITDLHLPKSNPDDAPRWQQPDGKIQLWNYSSSESLQGDGNAPMTTYYHVPPDLFYGDTQNVLLHLDYRYNAIPIGPISSMQVESNDAYLGSVPLVPGKEASQGNVGQPGDSGGEPAAVFQLDEVPADVSAAEERQLPGHGPGQSGGIDPSEFLYRPARFAPLGGDAESGAVLECGISVYPLCGPEPDHDCAARSAVAAGDGDLPDHDGALWRGDRISGDSRDGGGSGCAAGGRERRFPGDHHRAKQWGGGKAGGGNAGDVRG